MAPLCMVLAPNGTVDGSRGHAAGKCQPLQGCAPLQKICEDHTTKKLLPQNLSTWCYAQRLNYSSRQMGLNSLSNHSSMGYD